MTNPVVLLGTQSNGETLPVQVDATGRLVAEGLQGPPGEQGDPFTYDDFTPEQLEDLQGPPGPPGEDGQDGPNDLKPYGPEYSYLIIQNGKPTWVESGAGPEPPPPTDPVMLIDKRDESVSTVNQFGTWNDAGQYVEVEDETWDEYCRHLEVWDNPTGKRSGLGGLAPSGSTMTIPFTLNLREGMDRVLELQICGQWTGTDGNYGGYARHYYEISTDSDHLMNLTGKLDTPVYGQSMDFTKYTYNFLVTRPDLGLVNFNFRAWPAKSNYAQVVSSYIQRWRFVDPSVFFLKQLATRIAAEKANS